MTTNLTTLYADTILRVYGERVFALERLGADTLTELDAHRRLAVLSQRSVGRRSNPWDLLPVSDSSAWMVLYGEDRLARVSLDPDRPVLDGAELRLEAWAPTGGDALPALFVERDEDVVLILQRLRRFSCAPGEPGMALALPRSSLPAEGPASLPQSGEVEAVALHFCNPVTALAVPGGILIGSAGEYRVRGRTEDDGGIELLAPDGSVRILLTETDLGGRDVVRLRAGAEPDTLWVLAADADFGAAVLRLDLAAEAIIGEPLWDSSGAQDMLQVGGTLWVADREPGRAGLRRFDAGTGAALDARPIAVGGAPIQLVAGPAAACRRP